MRTWFYDLRFNRYEWARVWITSDGMISICSDYGNYGYWFGAPGSRGIRRFLTSCDPSPGGYLAIKFSDGERVYDGEATRGEIKKYILGERRTKEFSREQARDEWCLLDEHGSLEHVEEFHDWCSETRIEGSYEFYRDDFPGQVQGFMKHCWPVLVEAMKNELDAEEAFAEAFGTMQEMGV